MSSHTILHTVHASPALAANSQANHRPIPSALERACLAAKVASDNKGQDVKVLDLRKITPVFDFFVMATGPSRRVVHTIVEETDAAMRAVGDQRISVEGYDASKWVVQDYGDLLIHVFDPDTRDYYKLEELWADATPIDWQSELQGDRDTQESDEEPTPDLDSPGSGD